MKTILYTAMPFDNGQSGISDYIRHTLQQMSQKNQLIVYGFEKDRNMLPLNHHCIFKAIPPFFSSPLMNMLWHLLILPMIAYINSVDSVFLPAGNRRVMAFYPKFTAITVHDLSQFYIPQKYDKFRMFYVKKIIPVFLRRAPQIIAISHNTCRDLQKFYAIPLSKIKVSHNGYDHGRFKAIDKNQAHELVKTHFGLDDNYLLYISRLEHPGKNHLNLLKAYQRLPHAIKDNYKLVLVGSDWTGAKEIKDYVKLNHLEKHITFTGFVSSELLPALYSAATLYVFPSLYEGFGIPLLEAMACGVPIACSDRSALPEIGGSAVKTFDPENIESMTHCIQGLLFQPSLLLNMKTKGLQRVNQFQWSKHSEQIMACFNSTK